MSPTAPKRSRGRPAIPPEVQEERLIGAALRVIEDRGFEKMRISDIVREAGMSSRSFYESFDSKEDMMVEVVRRLGREFIRDVREIIEETEDPVEQIDRGLTRFLQIFTRAPVDLVGLPGQAAARLHHVLGDYVREVAATVYEEIRRNNERGRIRRAPNALQIELLFEGVLSLAVRYYSGGRGGELSGLRPVIMDQFVRTLL